MNSIHLSAGIVVAALLGACQSMPSNAPKATAVLEPTKGSTVRGTANFVQAGERVRLTEIGRAHV